MKMKFIHSDELNSAVLVNLKKASHFYSVGLMTGDKLSLGQEYRQNSSLSKQGFDTPFGAKAK